MSGVEHASLFLIAPCGTADLHGSAARLGEALQAGPVAAVLIHGPSESAAEALAAALVPVAQAAGAAAIVAEHSRVAGRSKADGIHIASGLADLKLAVDGGKPKRIVGAGGVSSRHAAMEAGEAGADYLLFGRPDGDTHAEAHPRTLDLAQWWSEVMTVPAVVMAGSGPGSIAEAAATGAEFVAVNRAIWDHPAGPAAAVREAVDLLGRRTRSAA